MEWLAFNADVDNYITRESGNIYHEEALHTLWTQGYDDIFSSYRPFVEAGELEAFIADLRDPEHNPEDWYVEFDGGDLNDRLTGHNPDGHDIGIDSLSGRGGDDLIYGLGGNDYLDGGLGSDWIEGGEGNDLIWGNQIRSSVVDDRVELMFTGVDDDGNPVRGLLFTLPALRF